MKEHKEEKSKGKDNENMSKSEKEIFEDPKDSGLIIERSDCCNAPINRTGGGLIIETCSACGGEPKMRFKQE